MLVLSLLHPFAKVNLFLFLEDFHFWTNVIFNWEAFVSTLVCSSHFSFIDPLGIVYELLQNCFLSNNFVNGLIFFSRYVGTLFEVMFHFQYCFFFLHFDF